MKKIFAFLTAMCCLSSTVMIANAEELLYTEEDIKNFNEDSFESVQFVFDAVYAAFDYLEENSTLDIRQVGDHLNPDNPSESYVEVIAGDEESAKNFVTAMEEMGYSPELFHITVNPSFICETDEMIVVKGDINLDKEIDVRDITMYLRCIVGLEKIPENAWSDINGDGSVDIKDLCLIKSYIIGTKSVL